MRRVVLVLGLALAGCTGEEPAPTTTSSIPVEDVLPRASTTTSTTSVCPSMREALKEAKEERVGSGRTDRDDAQQQAMVEDAARRAREAGCDISDLVGRNVGNSPATAAPMTSPPRARATTAPPTPEQSCHPSYQGACVPADASDVDCAGGSGDGPEYTGRVTVVGPDVYDLDRDGDGVGCQS